MSHSLCVFFSFSYLLISFGSHVSGIDFSYVCLMNKQTKEKHTEMEEKERERAKTDRMCLMIVFYVYGAATTRQDSQSAELTSRLIWVEWDSFSGFLHTLNHWMEKNCCSVHGTTTEFHIDIVCIVLVVAAAFLSLLVLFYDIFRSILEWIKIGWPFVKSSLRLCVCVRLFMCAQFLVRFINDVTFNICETWAQNQFRSGLFFAVCVPFPCTQIFIVRSLSLSLALSLFRCRCRSIPSP